VQNDAVGEDDPLVLGDDLHQVPLDLSRVGLFGEIEACGDALHVGIDYDAGGDMVSRTQNDVGSFAGDAGNGEKFLHGPRHLASEFVDHLLRRSDDGFGLVIEKPGGADILRQNFRRDGREVAWSGVFGEQAGSHFVHALIGTLRGKDCGHEQFPRVGMMQSAGGIGVHFRQEREDFRHAGLAPGCGFGPIPVSSYLDMRARFLLLAAALAAFGGSWLGGFHLDDYAIFAGSGPRVIGWPHPLTHLLGWLTYQLAGAEPAAFHAVNLLLHLAAVLLAYECLRRLLPAVAAVAAAAIFAVHPLQAQAVDYISARAELVVAALALAASLAWLTGRRRLAWVLAAASAAEAAGEFTHAYALSALRFLRLFLVPWGFTIAPDLHEPRWVSAAAALAVLALLAWRWDNWSSRSPESWALAGLALLIPGATAYLGLLAFAAAVSFVMNRRRIAAAAVTLLAAVSMSRTYVWTSDERLWREAVRRGPNLVEPKIQLAKSLRAADALDLLGRARQQAPYNPEIPAAIGKVLLDEQQYDGAVDELSRAIAMNPKNALAFNNRGAALAALGQIPAAAADFNRAMVLDPQLAEAHENLKRLTGK